MCDPKRQRDSLVVIARDAGMLPSHVIDLFRNASFAKANALAFAQLTEKLPEIAKDIADKSVDAKIECPSCFGEGEVEGIGKCPQCLGKGKVFRTSDLDRQKIALTSTGLLKQGAGVNVNVQQNNISTISPNTFFSKYVKSSDEAAYDVSDFKDAQIEEDP
jgi:RecJ-like exonuclease